MKIQDNVGYYFTIQDLQDRLRVSRSTILRLIESKKINIYQIWTTSSYS